MVADLGPPIPRSRDASLCDSRACPYKKAGDAPTLLAGRATSDGRACPYVVVGEAKGDGGACPYVMIGRANCDCGSCPYVTVGGALLVMVAHAPTSRRASS